MIIDCTPIGKTLVLVRNDGTLIEAGTPVVVLGLDACTYLEYTNIHRVLDKDGCIRAVYNFEINAHWREL